jgi:hypothetical protein
MPMWEVIAECEGPVIEIDLNTYESTGKPLQRPTKKAVMEHLRRQLGGVDAPVKVRRICAGAYGVCVQGYLGEWYGEFAVRTILDKEVLTRGK